MFETTTMTPSTDLPPVGEGRADETRARLVAAAMRRFGLYGYEATSLRAVVAEAGQNISSVKYHFGSKEGLFDACVRAAAARLRAEGPGNIVNAETGALADLAPSQARAIVREIIGAALRDALRPDLADEMRFLQREIVIAGRGAQIFYEAVLGHHVDFFERLIAIAEPQAAGDARLRAVSLMMQTVLFLSASRVIETAVGWPITSERIPALVDALYPETNSGPVA